jgi:hypothetical protein
MLLLFAGQVTERTTTRKKKIDRAAFPTARRYGSMLGVLPTFPLLSSEDHVGFQKLRDTRRPRGLQLDIRQASEAGWRIIYGG